MPVIDAQVGDTLLIETPRGQQRRLPITGGAHDLAQLPAQIDGTPYGYISFETLEWLGEPYGFTELDIVTVQRADKAYAQKVLSRIKDRAERIGYTIPLSLAAEPGQILLGDVLDAILLIMGVLGLLSLFLSAFLIVNTVTALLAQQQRQIGIMKALGARTDQLLGMYLAMVLFYGIVALLIAAPLSVVGARELSRFMATMFNFNLTAMPTPFQAILLQIGVGLLLPVLASIYPFLVGLRVTAAQAMSSYQIGKGRFGVGLIDPLLAGANLWFTRHVLLRPVVLSLRNTFRSKGRLTLTLLTLTLGGMIFVSVFSVRASVMRTLDDMLATWNFDTMIIFSRPYRIREIEQSALQVPGVVKADTWLQLSVRRVRPDGSEGSNIYLFAPHLGSEVVAPPVLVEGRWLLPGDDKAVVITAFMLKDEPDIQLGDQIVLKIAGREHRCQVIGIALGSAVSMIYASYDFIAPAAGMVGRADVALVATAQHDAAAVTATTKALEAHFEQVGLRVSGVGTITQELKEVEALFDSIIALMLIMAVLLAIVGGLGLMGTMSINVLERTREIGVLRAIGASNRGVSQVFIREGIVIGVISWGLGALLALPLSKVLSRAIGDLMTGAPLTFAYSMSGVWLWLILVVVLSALASFVPARNAAHLTVREVLAYE